MTLRLPQHLDAAVTARAVRDGVSKAAVVEAAVAAYTSQRSETLTAHARRVVERDAGLLERLSQ